MNYGDGSGVHPIVVGAGKSLALNHTFPANGLYTVTVTVNDDDTGSGTTTLEVYVGLELTITKHPLMTVLTVSSVIRLADVQDIEVEALRRLDPFKQRHKTIVV